MIGTIVGGFLVGAIACAVKPGKDNVGLIMTMVIGVVGVTLSKFILQTFGIEGMGGFVASLVATIGLLYVYDRFFG